MPTTIATRKRTKNPAPERIAEMAARGYMMQEPLAQKFGTTKMSLYNWEKAGKLADPRPGRKKRPVSILERGNRWVLIDAVAAHLGVRS
jgi:hypothetical protein